MKPHLRTTLALLLSLLTAAAVAQPTRVFSKDIMSLTARPNSEAGCDPVINLNNPDDYIDFDFDVLGHEYQRITYHIEHFDAQWRQPSDLLTSEYMEGMDGLAIEDYDKSLRTALLYTHYHFTIPNENVALRLSGNYRVHLIDDDTADTLASVGFMVNEARSFAQVTATPRTDRDISGRHQQLEVTLNYNILGVIDPDNELTVIARQNRRWDNAVTLTEPNIRSATTIAWTHRPELIFNAGTECHRFEMTEKRTATIGIDRLEYHAPYEHAILYPIERSQAYSYDEDHNGLCLVRSLRGDSDYEGEYLFVHFFINIPRQRNGARLFLQGDMTYGGLLPTYELQWDEEEEQYTATALLKQGYYEYRVVTDTPALDSPMGDFWEAENEYSISVYHRERGGRYDRLIGHNIIHTQQ